MRRGRSTFLLLATLLAAIPARGNTPDAARGSYLVTVFLPESDGSTDPSTEDWTTAMQTEVVDQVVSACLFWAEAAPDEAGFSCRVVYYRYSDTPTSYEPITRPGGAPLYGFWGGDEDEWINEMMDILGYSSVLLFYYQEVEDYNDAAQAEYGAAEAFSVFTVNSLNDADGKFSNDMFAYAPELRAPYLVMTWDNDGWRARYGAASLRLTASHEMAHLFGAEDEYHGSNSSCADVSNGFTNDNHEDCPRGARASCLMREDAPCGQLAPYPLCYWTRGMVGWAPECPPFGVCGMTGPWQCRDKARCVDASQVCDGEGDCGDASDELGCGDCAADRYRCADGGCVADYDDCACPDADRDGFRAARCGGDDCDDGNAAIRPGAAEICGDGIDQDCTGSDRRCDCPDADGDGFRDAACGGLDCDDANAAVSPDGEDLCGDGIDQDCSGTDLPCSCQDMDRDGYRDATCGGNDCDDGNLAISPGAVDVCGDGVDQDCSGADLACDCEDRDGDGFPGSACGGDDCDDDDPAVGGGWPDCPDAGGGGKGGCGCAVVR